MKRKNLSRRVRVAVFSSLTTAFILFIAFNLSSGPTRLAHEIAPRYEITDPLFQFSLGHMFGSPLTAGNKVTAFHNGDQIFPAMLEAIRQAKKTITFEIYIYWKGEIGNTFTDALCERARAGVRTHVLLDWLGSDKISEEDIERMKAAGVEVELFRPLRWWNLDRMNNRTHRRILVVDGTVGFTGGVGVADYWTGNAQDTEHWRDSHYRIEGPAVGFLQAAFMLNWTKMRPKVLYGEEYFPPVQPKGASLAQVVTSTSGGDGNENARVMFLLAIASARRSIRIANAYFVPDEVAVQQLVAAKQRGVHVKILVPGSKTDVPLTRRASRSLWEPLLKSGIEIYEYQPTMLHTKVMIVDETLVSVGSTNFDDRSFRLNDEANLIVLDSVLGTSESAIFDKDLVAAIKISLTEWQKRPVREKIIEFVAARFRSQI